MSAAEWIARAHAVTDEATPEPWHWAGNTDTGEPYLATWIPGAGRCQVLAIGHEDRSTTGRAAEEVRSYARECDADPDEFLQEWALDRYGEPVQEPRLWLYEDLMAVNARDRVVYEVAPQATTRDDPRVYRADVSDIRHPDAAFIAASRTMLPAAVAAIEAVLAREDVLYAEVGHQVYEATDLEPEECTDDCPACAIEEMFAAITAALDPS
jgi:hypothetical protein